MESMRILLLVLAGLVAGAIGPGAALGQRWTAVDVGFQHACALDDGGRAYCWGENGAGELGAPTPTRCFDDHHGHGKRCEPSPSAAPVAVAGGHRFQAIRAGYAITCGLTVEGRILCWGVPFGRKAGLVPMAPERTFRGVEESERTVCGMEASGGARCWRHRGEWREDAFLADAPIVAMDVQDFPTDVACAVEEGGRARCRGDNRNGQLGVAGQPEGFAEVAGGRTFTAIRTAEVWTCALAAGGEAYCWGLRRTGAVPAAERSADAPDQCGYAWCSRVPTRVADGFRFRALDRGREEMCGLTEAGEVFCWTYDGKAAPSAAGTRFRAISGGYHQWCGITEAGALACWEWDKAAPPTPVPPPATQAR